ncbi:MAG: tRNA (guanosine(46)-N7)-methyltransferase TrmB [Bacteroidota bacterium]
MSKRNKLQKFAEILSYPHVLENFNPLEPKLLGENGAEVERKGIWQEAQFGNEAPLIVELACGRGEYSVAMARMYPQRNFIGVDVKGARIWKGATIALQENLTNVAFLRTRIEQIELFFAPEEVDEIWITFPDPFPSKENRRLTAAPFIDRYRKILKKGGLLNFKTDDPDLFEYSVRVLEKDPQVKMLYKNDDIYAESLYMPELEIKTYYEQMHLANQKTIKFLQCTIH